MKTLTKLSAVWLLLLAFASNSYSQTCSSAVMKYSGPANTTQLTTLLNTTSSSYPLITALTSAQKSSLETYVGFSTAGIPLGLTGSDSNIVALYADSTYCSALFAEIFNQQAFMHRYGGGPAITSITMSQFNTMISGGIVYRGGGSWCTNCTYGYPPDICCHSCDNCGTCSDQIISIGGTWYSVTP